jgi:hypothetical protein
MLKVFRECAPWLSWKVGAVLAAVVLLAVLAFGERAGLLAILGATPLLAVAACLMPCLIPIALLRGRRTPQGTEIGTHPAQAASSCNCGSDVSTIGDGPDACRSETTVSDTRA